MTPKTTLTREERRALTGPAAAVWAATYAQAMTGTVAHQQVLLDGGVYAMDGANVIRSAVARADFAVLALQHIEVL